MSNPIDRFTQKLNTFHDNHPKRFKAIASAIAIIAALVIVGVLISATVWAGVSPHSPEWLRNTIQFVAECYRPV